MGDIAKINANRFKDNDSAWNWWWVNEMTKARAAIKKELPDINDGGIHTLLFGAYLEWLFKPVVDDPCDLNGVWGRMGNFPKEGGAE